MAVFLIESGKRQGSRISLKPGDLIVGRDAECTIRIASADVSRRHCLLRVTKSEVICRDLGSRNGTFVNDVAIEVPTAVQAGDQLRIGPLILKLLGPSPSRKPTPPPGQGAPAGADEDVITEWLSDTSDSIAAVGDTTIIPSGIVEQVRSEPEPYAVLPDRTPLPEVPRVFRSVADEAADIIRRHHASRRPPSDDLPSDGAAG